MASTDRSATNHLGAERLQLLKALESNAYSFDFFQALRLLDMTSKEKKKIGYAVKPSDDSVRFGQQPSMAFSPSTIAGFKGAGKGFAPRMEVFFFGLFGPNGPLPLHLTEYARARIQNFDDEGFARFVDIFHHRLLSFFYRAWSDAKPHVNLDRPAEDVFSYKLASLIGIGTPALSSRDAIPDFTKYNFAGRFAAQARNAEGLLAVLDKFFTMPVSLKQFVGSWLTIPTPDRLRLGSSKQSGMLGLNSTLGARVWECQSKFTLKFGPLDLAAYKRLLPGTKGLAKLVAMVRNYVGDEFDWDVQLVLAKAEIRPTQLGSFGQLGWTTWIAEDVADADFEELRLNPQKELAW